MLVERFYVRVLRLEFLEGPAAGLLSAPTDREAGC
jgi:hypothetical protein